MANLCEHELVLAIKEYNHQVVNDLMIVWPRYGYRRVHALIKSKGGFASEREVRDLMNDKRSRDRDV